MSYNPREIEQKWLSYWKEHEIYKVSNQSEKPKYYVLDMFPYPSGAGLHVGHPLGYISSDIFARYKRLKGFNVLHPMGFDAFGLPAEEYAIQTGIHPAESTARNMERYREQLANLGFSFDWSREVSTCDPKYYKWTQWIFTLLFEHYYDLEANKALPIHTLEEKFAQSGNSGVQAVHAEERQFTSAEWQEMTEETQQEILMNYRLAYRKVGYVNWCEALGTVLANDQVKDGLSERGGHPVVQKALTQWYLRITAYAERMLNDLDTIDWSDALKTIQTNWIGRSVGAAVYFSVEGMDKPIEIFTTRPDTIFGATYMVLAPEHDLVEQITTDDQREAVEAYVNYVKARSEVERMSEKKVTGTFTGAYAINPMNQARIPIWIGEYVLKDYGTGAIMAVPAEDERDHQFAEKFALPIIPVVDKTGFESASIGAKVGQLINSDFLDGMDVKTAIDAAIERIATMNVGQKKVNYKMRDANFSRQRYWGEPFPIVYNKKGIAHSLNLNELPIELPETDDFKPGKGGKSPLSRIDSWVKLSNGFTRETDTMPAVAGSSWYFLRYMDPHNEEAFVSEEAVNYWREVDLYVGGSEHAVAHLMYARFWHKFLYDLGKVPTIEPFKKLINQGMIQGVIEFMYLQKEKVQGVNRFVCASKANAEMEHTEFVRIPVHIDFVVEYGSDNSYMNRDSIDQFLAWRPEFKDAIFECGNGIYQNGAFKAAGTVDDSHLMTHSEVGKMSKSKFNVINPDDVIEQYGADCFRMYEMFLGPIEQAKPWDTKGIDGVSKFLRRFYGLYFDRENHFIVEDTPAAKEAFKVLHTTLKKVTDDIERFSFNTCVSAFMVASNELKKLDCHSREILEPLAIAIAPFAPHLAEELWHALGHEGSVHHAQFPAVDEQYLKEDAITYPLSINGKKRATIDLPTDLSKEDIEVEALKAEAIQKYLEGKQVRKVIVVPNRMINIVVG